MESAYVEVVAWGLAIAAIPFAIWAEKKWVTPPPKARPRNSERGASTTFLFALVVSGVGLLFGAWQALLHGFYEIKVTLWLEAFWWFGVGVWWLTDRYENFLGGGEAPTQDMQVNDFGY